MFDARLIQAEILKLRRRPGMVSIAALLTVGSMLIAYVVMAIQHNSNPAKYGPAGGLHNYQNTIGFLTLMVMVAAAIVGATAGAQDLESGVFRDSAATGRSRLALFGARVPGALAIVLPITLLAAAVPAVASVTLNGSLAAPGGGALFAGTASVLVAGAVATTAAIGLSAVVASRGTVIGIMLAFLLAIAPLLEHLSFLGNARDVLPNPALNRIGDLPTDTVQPALITAIVVLFAWAAATYAAGAWKTRTREI